MTDFEQFNIKEIKRYKNPKSEDELFDLDKVEENRRKIEAKLGKEKVLEEGGGFSRRDFIKNAFKTAVGIGASNMIPGVLDSVRAGQSVVEQFGLDKKNKQNEGCNLDQIVTMKKYHKEDLLGVFERKDVTPEQKAIISRIVSGEELLDFTGDKNFPFGNFLVEQQKIRDLQRAGEMASLNANKGLKLSFDEGYKEYKEYKDGLAAEYFDKIPTQALQKLSFENAKDKDVKDWSLYIKDVEEWNRQLNLWEKNNRKGWQNFDSEKED